MFIAKQSFQNQNRDCSNRPAKQAWHKRHILVTTVFFFGFFFLPIHLFSQEYFQQEVNYEIHVALDDKQHVLHASETIAYSNNSDSTLQYIWFHLWPNAYKDPGTALSKQKRQEEDLSLFFSRPSDRGWIDSLQFKVDDKTIRFEFDAKHKDICKVFLPEPLLPGKSVTINTPFRVQLPKGIFSRLGHLDQAYQITQWYPKPAVFDNKGWHPMPYLGQGEFYSEFGTFDVHITLPKNYVVGATGDLINGESELEWLNQKVEKTVAIDTYDYNDLSFPTSSTDEKTLHFHQENVHDFAWFADKRYHVLKGEVALPITGRKVTTWAMFTNNEAGLWKNAIDYLNDATYYYSLWVGEYPYNQVTAVDGVLSEGGGMEYPNITIIGQSENAHNLEITIIHEVGHNWFYGILGSNERKHPWMDEGINSFVEQRYMSAKHPNLLAGDVYGLGKFFNFLMKWLGIYNLKSKNLNLHGYTNSARGNTDQPIELSSEDYTSTNYGTSVYLKTAVAFNYLKKYLGTEQMDTLMHTYFRQWKYKHPYPADFKKVATTTTGDSLNWFFNDMINTVKKLDYAVSSIKKQQGKLVVEIRNVGEITSPFPVSAIRGKDTVVTQWFSGIEKSGQITLNCADCDKVVIDAEEITPDINRKNNTIRVNGIFRKTEPLQPRLIAYYENPYRSQFAAAPILGWNNYDGFMLGAAVYNNLLPVNKFDYTLMPMYAFRTNTVTGYARLAYTFHQKNHYPDITLSVQGQRFDVGQISPYYNQSDGNSPQLPNNIIRPEIKIHFQRRKRRMNLSHNIRLRNNMYFSEGSAKLVRNIPQLTYNFNHAFAPHITEVNADLQWLNNEAKLSL
ncbi:M1 family metallopeptidase, partial [Bacteroidota bacterium]